MSPPFLEADWTSSFNSVPPSSPPPDFSPAPDNPPARCGIRVQLATLRRLQKNASPSPAVADSICRTSTGPHRAVIVRAPLTRVSKRTMSAAPRQSPETTLADADPGDETANRYRFQWTWAAVVACMLLDDTEDILEVFCEHHEDVLLKHRDGSFSGHQVKTRDDNQPPWKANETQVVSAFARFAKLDVAYPNRFRRFCFCTNHSLHPAKNGTGIRFILSEIETAATLADLPRMVSLWIGKVAKVAQITERETFAAISKADVCSDLPKLRDATIRLMHTISQAWAPASECSMEAVRRAARSLIDECTRASSLDHQQLLRGYVLAPDIDDSDVVARIDGKRITPARVSAILEAGRDSTAILAGDPDLGPEPGSGSTDLLQRKLAAGGFSAVSTNSAEDLRDKADYLGIRWTKRYGTRQGLQRYDHVCSTVLSDAGRAFDATQTDEGSFGPAMREDFRRRIRERRANGDELFDCTDDHLEGVAFSLTSQCRIAWSNSRPWETS